MLRFVGRLLAAGLFLFAGASQAQVVISQVYGAGGNTGATYNRDFVELFNRGSTPVSLSGLTVQYASATGTGNFSVGATLPNVNLAPGQYHLVGMSSGANGAALPTVDTSGTSSMATAAGKVVLVNSTTALACNGGSTPCSGAQQALIVDLVGYGNANFFEGTAAAPTLSNVLSAMRAANGCTDSNQNGADFAAVTPAARNSASTLQSCSGGSLPLLAVSDVSAFEGDSGTTTMIFGFGLSAPAGVGGVTITYATADGTATAGSDYVAAGGTVTIPEGANSTTVAITINGDTTAEANETFFVRVSAATGATISDGEGLGTIQNDDVTVVAIHDIQGPGLTSPINGATVTTEGIVTALKFNNGFFLQTADANVDADPATSQGIFVFTSTAPPATAAVGNRIRVSGTVTEFTPSTNLNQLSITEIVSVTSIQVLSTGNPLPAPVDLTAADFSATATPGTAEKYEGMRVRVAQGLVVSGSDGNITESSANSSTTGVFYVVLPTVQRPFREPGIGILDTFPIPGGKTPPRFDTNQERLMVRSRGQVGATPLALDAEAQIADMTGVMDYFSGTWALLPDVGSGTASGGKTPTAVADAGPDDVTIGGFNLLRFFDEVNNSNGAPTLTAAALDKRLTKTSLAICDFVKAPDILGVVEVENLRVLGLLADRINANCARAPLYVPYLIDGNDVGGINVGFLVSTRLVGSNPRVEVLEVTQFGKDTVFNNPNGSTSLLNDRPPLMLRAIVHGNGGATYPVTAIVNHLRSLNGIDDTAAGSSGWPTEGDRVRAKRLQQAVFLANLVQARQVADPAERIILLGDFNAFEFSDGYADVMGVVRGNAAAENQVIAYAASPITRPLVDGSALIPAAANRYSYVFEGNAQTLDHVVLNEPMIMDAAGIVVDHARINADFGVHNYGVAGNGIRVSDHDPVRVAISVAAFKNADLGITATAAPATVHVGGTATYTVTASNAGPASAESASVALVFDAVVSPTVTAPAGWTCAAPVQDATTTTVTCTTSVFANGGSATFTASVPAGPELGGQSLALAAAVASQFADPNSSNNQAVASVAVRAAADLATAVSASQASIPVGGTASYVVTVTNNGPNAATTANVALSFDALVTPTVTAPAGWTCAAPTQTGSATNVACSATGLAASAFVQFNVSFVAGAALDSRTVTLAATASTSTLDPVAGNNQASASVQVASSADLSVRLMGRSERAGVFLLSVNNAGPSAAQAPSLTITGNMLPRNVVLVPAAGWTCTTTAVGTGFSSVCNASGPLAAGADAYFGLVLAGRGPQTVTVTATVASATADPNTANNSASRVVRSNGLPLQCVHRYCQK